MDPSSASSAARKRLSWVAAVVAALSIVCMLLPWTSFGDWIAGHPLVEALTGSDTQVLAMVVLPALFLASALLFLPVTPLILFAMLGVGSLFGSIWSLVGLMIAAQVGFVLGRVLGHRDIRQLRMGMIYRASRFLRHRGTLMSVILRVLPVAHFAAVSFTLGASHIRWWQYTLGTAIGSCVTVSVMAVMFEGTAAAAVHPSPASFSILAAITVVLGGLLIWLHKYGQAWMRKADEESLLEEADSC